MDGIVSRAGRNFSQWMVASFRSLSDRIDAFDVELNGWRIPEAIERFGNLVLQTDCGDDFLQSLFHPIEHLDSGVP